MNRTGPAGCELRVVDFACRLSLLIRGPIQHRRNREALAAFLDGGEAVAVVDYELDGPQDTALHRPFDPSDESATGIANNDELFHALFG